MENEKYFLVIWQILSNLLFFFFFLIERLCVTAGIVYYWDEAGKGRLTDGFICIADMFYSHPSKNEGIKECEGET